MREVTLRKRGSSCESDQSSMVEPSSDNVGSPARSKSNARANLGRVLFVTYGGGHVNMVIPVIKELHRLGGFDVRVLGLTTAGPVLTNHRIPWFGFKDLLRENDYLARHWGEKLSRENEHPYISREESIAYLGLSYWDLITRTGEAAASERYALFKRQAFLPVSIMERLLRELRPDLLVATNSPRAERAAIEAAGGLGIPAVCLVDLLALHEIAYIGRAGYANRVCVLSEYVQKLFLAAGRTPEEVVVTGNPAFDRLASPELEEECRRFRVGKNWGTSKVILWASNVEPKLHPFTGEKGDESLPQRVEDELVAIVQRRPEWRLVVRPHPGENRTQIPRGLHPRIFVSPQSDPISVVLGAVDCVVTLASTVGLEAYFLRKPLISIDLSVFTPDLPLQSMGMSLGISALDQLEGALDRVFLTVETPTAKVPEIGNATERVVQVVRDLLSQNRS